MTQFMKKAVYWTAFVICQVTGFVVLSFFTFNTPVAPLFLAGGLPLPSSVVLPLAPDMPMSWLICLAVPLDFAAWFVFFRWGSWGLIGETNRQR